MDEGTTRAAAVETALRGRWFAETGDGMRSEVAPRDRGAMRHLCAMHRSRARRLVAIAMSLGFAAADAAATADVPTFKSGEYQVTTTVAGSETGTEKVCLTDYGDWFGSLQQDFRKRGCELVPEGQSGAVYRYRASCESGVAGTLEVTKFSESSFASVAEIELPIGGFKQAIATRQRATRIGNCPTE